MVGVVPAMARGTFWQLGHLDGHRCLSNPDVPWMRAQRGASGQVAPDNVARQLDPGTAAAAEAPQDEFVSGYGGGAQRLLEAGGDLDPACRRGTPAGAPGTPGPASAPGTRCCQVAGRQRRWSRPSLVRCKRSGQPGRPPSEWSRSSRRTRQSPRRCSRLAQEKMDSTGCVEPSSWSCTGISLPLSDDDEPRHLFYRCKRGLRIMATM